MDDLRSLAAIDAVVADLYAQYPADGDRAIFVASTYVRTGSCAPPTAATA